MAIPTNDQPTCALHSMSEDHAGEGVLDRPSSYSWVGCPPSTANAWHLDGPLRSGLLVARKRELHTIVASSTSFYELPKGIPTSHGRWC